VRLDGLWGEEEPLTDRLVGTALGHQREDLSLAIGQRLQRMVPAASAEQLRHHLGVDGGAAPRDPAHRVRELVDVRDPVFRHR
jgi:hypothetical protein